MVNLPLFKLGALFVRHVSKYGANHIKAQAHEHPHFRVFAARYGQVIHQLNMRLNVALLRNSTPAKIARDKATAPTVKTKEQTEREAAAAKKAASGPASSSGNTSNSSSPGGSQTSSATKEVPTSVWRRKFKPLPEAKAVDLFADVIGDSFILGVAIALLLYEFWRSSSKPDANTVRYEELSKALAEIKEREEKLAEQGEAQSRRIQTLEDALNKRWSILPSLSSSSPQSPSCAGSTPPVASPSA
ncbi:hypothetical protein CFIMG_005467RA [Ceratocystis fimbriata CBS 114723]|uniref:OPA3-like protein n=1 Tax=Ceratocystis fimbriata CBS 114723 TaxID=1035309 RepID=A0A2C5X254_9PEZI|nr:hypothetical protein CFIMG_005467RA [Ceratocystis fimbriata CBS 114723]